tara:strand:+ start:143 stop:766 length:624 start_codon:yes stop_codon:yes gene_type:complete
MKKSLIITPDNLGWIQTELDDIEIDHLWNCIDNQKEDYKQNLAGNITGSYSLVDKSDWFFNNTLKPAIKLYAENFTNMGWNIPTTGKHLYKLTELWVNYQYKHEFNPLHDHGGVYSFVIWMKIPTSFDDQKKNPITNRINDDSISNFQFQYLNILGQSMNFNYKMSPEWEGTMLFFPSQLLHIVYPFYNCDDERISISGNIMVDTSK